MPLKRSTTRRIIRSIIAAAVLAFGYWAITSYFSPYETCLRDAPYSRWEPLAAKHQCAHLAPDAAASGG